MPVGSELTVAGPATITIGGASAGLFEGDQGVPSITRTSMSQRIESTTRYGRALIDEAELGDNYTWEAVALEYSRAKTVFLDMLAAWGRQPVVGRFKYSAAAIIILTAIAGTTAATVPASITMSKAVPASDFPVRIFYGPQLRVVPLRYNLLPYDVGGGVAGNFTET